MLTCESCRNQLLDYSYGLLEAAEARVAQMHLVTCPACAAEAKRLASLLKRAARESFPGVTFDPNRATPKSSAPAKSSRGQWIKWTVAAGLFLAATALGGPALVDGLGYARYRPRVESELAAVNKLDSERKSLTTEIAKRRKDAAAKVEEKKTKQSEIESSWIAAETTALKKASERPFQIQLTGPGTAIPGAPNEYRIRITDTHGKAQAAIIEAAVTDGAGKELFSQRFDPEKNLDGNVLKLPVRIWAGAKPDSDVLLHVSVVDPKTGARTELTENLKMMQPVFTTFLTTDKPMYRPGEVVYYRSLTLDRAKFLPPTSEQTLRFEILGPAGQVLADSQTLGLAKPSTINNAGIPTAILGPDAKPIRGIGTGAYPLGADLPGGEYILKVWGSEPGRRESAKPLAIRKFLVNKYTPDRLLKKLEFDGKTYGPGDRVAAKFELKDQATPLANASVVVEVSVDGQLIIPSVNPTKTEIDGTATLQFTLPAAEHREARVSIVASANGITETLVRPVPLATRKLNLEFFPEGGELIAGVSNRVYFRATTTFGKPADVAGWLTDGTRDLAPIATLTDAKQPGANQGLGRFEFTPVTGQRYAVRLDRPTSIVPPVANLFSETRAGLLGAAAIGTSKGYDLPASKENGIVLSVPMGVLKPDQPIPVRVASIGSDRTVLIGAYSRGRPVAHATIKLPKGQVVDTQLPVAEAKLGGVTRITVFDLPGGELAGREELQPLAERLMYRHPGETLKLQFEAKSPKAETQTKSFIPGSRVALDLRSTDESDAPKAAILWAAVVNESVITMADEKTERMLPTHFLLSGEVRNGDELEHSDFLLTEHPKAAESLDLLLGTQGWRRFAEQAPTQFHKTVPVQDAERLMLASAGSAPIPTGWRTEMRNVFEEYWPKYEANLLELETAERENFAAQQRLDPEKDLVRANAEYQQKLTDFGKEAVELEVYDRSLQTRRNFLALYLIPLFSLAGTLLVARWLFLRRGDAGRISLAVASIGLLLLVGGIAGVSLWSGRDNDGWRSLAAVAPKPERRQGFAGADKKEMAVGPDALPPAQFDDKFRPPDAKNEAGFRGKLDREFEPGEKAAPMAGPPAMAMAGGGGFPRGPQVIQAPAPFGKPGGGMPMRAMVGRGQADKRFGEANEQLRGGARLEERLNQFELADAKRIGRRDLAMKTGDVFMPPTAGERFTVFLRKRNEGLARAKGGAGIEKQSVGYLESILPQTPPLIVREYAHAPSVTNGDDSTRTDFTETLLWQPVLVASQNGKATVEFTLSDAVSPYRVLIAGHTLDGRIGAVTGTIEVRKPFSLDPKLPVEIGSSDTLDVALLAANATDNPLTAKVSVQSKGLKILGTDQPTLELPAVGGGRTFVRLQPEKMDGTLSVKLDGKAGPFRDSIERNLAVVADGFPASGSHSDVLESSVAAKLKFPGMIVPGSLQLKAIVYPNTLSEVQAGLDGLLREPSGCFEQSSTSNYPNVLVLEYLNETNQAKPDVSKRAKMLLDNGYAKLTSFECAKPSEPNRQGYEWFGGTAPPHEALTAYGLLQFTDMSRVHPVDAAMLKRTKDYLLSRRDGKGGFERNARALDSFGYAPGDVTNAYIVWAITESERKEATKTDLKIELDAILKRATDGERKTDSYYLGLAANSLINAGRKADGIGILKSLVKQQVKDGSVAGGDSTITNSSGQALTIETTGLAMLGWLKVNETGEFRAQLDSGSKWLGSQKSGFGAYGSTQSTILTLKALIEYARSQKRTSESGEIKIIVDGGVVVTKKFTTENVGPIVLDIPDAEKFAAKGTVDIRIETDAKQAYPVTFAWEARCRVPQSSDACPLNLETKLDKVKANVGDTLRLIATVTNSADKEQGMVTAILGIPAGLKLPEDLKQLKAMTERPEGGREKVSYFEIRGRELILYWRGMAPKQTVELNIDLIAEFPGVYRGPASRVYLYYGAEHKRWIAPVDVTIDHQ